MLSEESRLNVENSSVCRFRLLGFGDFGSACLVFRALILIRGVVRFFEVRSFVCDGSFRSDFIEGIEDEIFVTRSYLLRYIDFVGEREREILQGQGRTYAT